MIPEEQDEVFATPPQRREAAAAPPQDGDGDAADADAAQEGDGGASAADAVDNALADLHKLQVRQTELRSH